MAQFPVLRTGAAAQYPLPVKTVYSTDVVRFVDGSEQRSRRYSRPLRRWELRLDLLDEAELAALETFFRGQSGADGIFSFTDPRDGTVYANCSFESGELAWELLGAGSGRLQIVIGENRG